MTKKKDSAPSPMAVRPLRLRMDSSPEEVRVEIVPLIDVIFCILTFFILAAVTLSRQQALSVDLPKASTAKAQGREILMVSLNEFGQLYVEQEPVVTQEQFKKKLQAYRQTNPYGLMALYASKEASYNEVVQVLDVLRQVGGDRVALATLPGSSGQSIDFIPSLPSGTGVPKVNSPGNNSSDALNDILKFLPGSTNKK